MENQPKKAMTEEERAALATKLDKELDEFIANLPKRERNNEPPDENWLEEFDKHPFFMKKLPEPGEEMHPLYEGLQQLKYDPNENTPDELAISYKDDGNFNFKHKNYRMAIISYSEGLKVKCGNLEVEATLYNNRSACHFFLKNYRSCIRDCEWALKIKPEYRKAAARAATACLESRRYEDAVQFAEKLLEMKRDDEEALDVRSKALAFQKEAERDARKQKAVEKKRRKKESELLAEISKRNLIHEGGLTIDKLKPKFQELMEFPVDLVDGALFWPTVFVYPEYQFMDFVQEFNENTILMEQMKNVFEVNPEWDVAKQYSAQNLNVYYASKNKVFKVDTNKSLGEIIQSKDFVIRCGTLSFMFFPRGSKAETDFLDKY